ncbi:MAG: citramalate synthase [Candidatus Bathyarchaeota archaeon]|nr:citramalate synthase [Candidatus Bathyarchaeota archaeon]
MATKFSTNLKKLLYKSNSKENYSEFNNVLSSDIVKIVKNHNQSKNIEFYDTTLRDGNQAVGINFSVEDKLKIARRLSDFGIDLIEGGWPSEANSSEIEFFRNLKNEKLGVPISAIGATRKPNSRTEKDQNLIDLLSVNTDYTTIVGKSWKLHVEKVLETTEKENLGMITESVKHLRDKGRKVIYDAEHFFDGYKEDKEYALRTLEKAAESGAKTVVLCDTRGNSLPSEVFEVTRNVKDRIKESIGIHAHNDKGLALANSLFAIMAGANHFQGTVNGIGERCGNANLIEFIANLELSLGYKTGLDLTKLTRLSDYVFEIANLNRNNYMPFVGRYAFAHKAGLHGHAVLKFPKAYESIDPSLVGNARMISISSQAGLANIVSRAKDYGFQLDRSDQKAKNLLWKIKEMEAKGYNFENANATLHLLYAKNLGDDLNYFDLVNWRAFVTGESGNVHAECSVKLMVNQETLITAGEGNGPVNAFDVALKKALQVYYPELTKVRLIGYRVREIDVEKGTAAIVRVFIEFEAEGIRWSTVGVSPNVLKASEEALVDGYVYFLYRRGSKKKNIESS